MKCLVLNLPLPPSVNALFANVPGRGRVRTKVYRTWSKTALDFAWLSKPQGGFPRFDGAFDVQITVALKMRGDIDNRIKPLLDFLASAGIIENDKHAHGASIARSADIHAGMCRVHVYETKEAA
jgi:Holliday junction resolvase RusA-like endonuclease